MPRSATPRSNTRWVVFDTKNMRLYHDQFFFTEKQARDWVKQEFRHYLDGVERPRFIPRKDWEKRKEFFDNHIIIVRARWHISRHDALKYGLVETQTGNE